MKQEKSNIISENIHNDENGLAHALSCLPGDIAGELMRARFPEELRLRAGRPAILRADGEERVLARVCDAREIEAAAISLSGHSLCSITQETRQGFFTVRGGVRVGLAGRAVAEGERVSLLRGFTSLALRFPRELRGIARGLAPYLCDGGFLSTLIISAPGAGKTTLLRDIVRCISDGDGFAALSCSVIDERAELFPRGFDPGLRTDVLELCPKAAGMMMALRSLCPGLVAADEIGSEAEARAIAELSNCGVRILATAHAASFAELFSRRSLAPLITGGCIRRVVLLGESMGRGTLEQIYDERGAELLSQPSRLARSAA